jgi:3',5'-cyclic AMP phosphodiesterase CpdA
MAIRPLRNILAVTAAAAILSCSTFPAARYEKDPQLRAALASPPAYPEVRFAVLSDLHYLDPALWSEGPAIQAYLREDRKLLKEGDEILREAGQIVAGLSTDLVLIPGDLTKDGERSSHLRVADELRALEAGGARVFVTCGNHDLLNHEALRYDGERTAPVDSVDPGQFAEIYAEFGFAEALARDPSSLSYVAEPLPGLRVLALDACLYGEEPVEGHTPSNGRFSAETLEWLDRTLADAASQGAAVLAILHHGITEHYPSQAKHYGEYIVDQAPAVARLLAAYNVRIVLTGHYHAQDITLVRWKDGRFVYDVETGSLVTYPCPIRVGEIRGNSLSLQSCFVEQIPSRPSGFREFARQNTSDGISGIAVDTMLKLKVQEQDARFIAPQIARAFVAHYAGDEQPPELLLDKKGVGFMGRLVLWSRRSLVEGLWADLEPPDDGLAVDLATGAWRRLR